MGIKSLDELRRIRDENKNRVDLRRGEDYKGDHTEILVGMATCGIAAGARETLNAITRELASRGIDNVKVVPVGCIGCCNLEPVIMVNVPGQKSCAYGHVRKERVPEIIEGHIVDGKPLQELLVDIKFDRSQGAR